MVSVATVVASTGLLAPLRAAADKAAEVAAKKEGSK